MANNTYKNLEAIEAIIIRNIEAIKEITMTNSTDKNLEVINAIIGRNHEAIKKLQTVNIALMYTFKSMVNEETAPTSDGLETRRRLCGDHEEHEMVRFRFKFGDDVITRLAYKVDEMDFKKVPNIIMSCLRNGGGTININNTDSIEIEYFDWDGKGAIFVNSDTEDLKRAYTRFIHIAEL